MKGVFITFEGPEGAGKSTHAGRVAARLADGNEQVLCTREPGGTPAGEAIRGLLQHDAAGEPPCAEAEVLLFAASRAQLVQTVLRPALAAGKCVVCDRFADSTTAYQGYGRGFPIEQVQAINRLAAGGLSPDVTILLDLPVARGFERLRRRGAGPAGGARDRIEREAEAFHERVRQGYLELARRWPERIRVVDAMREEAAVAADVWRWVSAAVEAKRGRVGPGEESP